MASTTLPVFLAVIGAFLCLAPGSLGSSEGYVSSQGSSGERGADNAIRFKFTAHATVLSNWKMSAYANSDLNPTTNPEGLVADIAEADDTNDVNFDVEGVKLPGFGGCEGEKKYPCFIVKRDPGSKDINKCHDMAAACIPKNSGSSGSSGSSEGYVASQGSSGERGADNAMSFTFTAHATVPSNWKMSAYANSDLNPITDPEGLVADIAEADATNDVNFDVEGVKLPGFGGCEGEKKYPCFIVKRDPGSKDINKCLDVAAACIQ